MANDFISVNNDPNQVYEVMEGPRLLVHSTAAAATTARNSGGGSYVNKSTAWFNVVGDYYTILANPG